MRGGRIRLTLPRLPSLSIKESSLDTLPELPEIPATTEATGTPDFEQRFREWGRGPKAEFTVYDYLTTDLKLSEGTDFYYQPGIDPGASSLFITPGHILRVKSEVPSGAAQDAITRMQYEQQGYTVVDFEPYDLQPGMAQAAVAVALGTFSGIG